MMGSTSHSCETCLPWFLSSFKELKETCESNCHKKIPKGVRVWINLSNKQWMKQGRVGTTTSTFSWSQDCTTLLYIVNFTATEILQSRNNEPISEKRGVAQRLQVRTEESSATHHLRSLWCASHCYVSRVPRRVTIPILKVRKWSHT